MRGSRKRTVLLAVAALYATATLACGPGTPTPPAPTPTAAPVKAAVPSVPTAVPAQPTVAATPIPATPTPSSSDTTEVRPRTTPVRTPQHLQDAFDWAAKEFDVPVDILLAVGYSESRWEQHNGEPSTAGGYGIMHLTDVPDSTDPSQHTLQSAVRLLNALPDSPFEVTADELKTDPYQNIRGGAALLAQYEIDTVGKGTKENEADWYGAIAKYSGSKDYNAAIDFADQVYTALGKGEARTTDSGEPMHLDAKSVVPNQSSTAALTIKKQTATFKPDCPPDLDCTAVPALYQLRDTDDPTDVGNYAIANRPNDGMPIQYIVIHDTETSVKGAISTFQEPADETSAHYIVKSSDGSVVQMVPVQDVAYHARNWYVNSHAIGVEHEGIAIQGATWYTETMYESSAKLVRYLAQKYHVPLDRAHIVGHDNVPGLSQASQVTQHWDPGPYWDWDHYMELLGAPVKAGSNPNILTIHPDFANNVQTLAESCTKSACTDLPSQPTNFLLVHTAPSADSPLVEDPATSILSHNGQGTRLAADWGDQAATDSKFYRLATQGDWDEIWFGGQKGWIYDPGHQNTMPGDGIVIRTRADRGSLIPLYGQPLPEIQAYPNDVVPPSMDALTYISGGQTYVAVGLVGSDYLNVDYRQNVSSADKVVRGKQKYYEIYFNHRFAFLSADDVEVVSQ